MQKFYKIENGKAQVGQGTFVPDGFIVYEDEPQELIDALSLEKQEQELQHQIAEAKQYLASTDHKFYNGYKPKADEDLVEIERLRDEAREFIRTNEGDK